jgi:hypothetical protein
VKDSEYIFMHRGERTCNPGLFNRQLAGKMLFATSKMLPAETFEIRGHLLPLSLEKPQQQAEAILKT